MKKFVALVVLVLAGSGILVAGSVSSGFAQDPDPKQIVALTSASGNSIGPCAVSQLVVDSMIDPADGSLSPFVIPPKKALILLGGQPGSVRPLPPGRRRPACSSG
jgi:hypothetical protein